MKHPKILTRYIITGAVLLFFAFNTLPAYAEEDAPISFNLPDISERGLQVEFEMSFKGMERAEAKHLALKESEKIGLQRLLEDLLRPHTLKLRKEEIQNNFLHKSFEYIRESKVNSFARGRQADIVKSLVKYDLEKLIDDLYAGGYEFSRKKMPTVAVVIPLKPIDGKFPTTVPEELNEGELALMDYMSDVGFKVLRRRDLLRAIDENQAPELIHKDDFTAGTLALMAGADILIRGSAELTKGPEKSFLKNSGLHTIEATVYAHAVRTYDGVLLHSDRRIVSTVHLSYTSGGASAVKEAIKQFKDSFLRQVLKKWLLTGSGINRVIFYINEIPNRAALRDFVDELENDVPSVVRVIQVYFRDGEARVDVDYKDDRESFLDRIEQKNLIVITSQEENKMQGHLPPKTR